MNADSTQGWAVTLICSSLGFLAIPVLLLQVIWYTDSDDRDELFLGFPDKQLQIKWSEQLHGQSKDFQYIVLLEST